MCAGCWVDYRWALDVECLLLLYKKFVTDQTLICKKTIHRDGNMVWWNFEAQLDMTSTYMGVGWIVVAGGPCGLGGCGIRDA